MKEMLRQYVAGLKVGEPQVFENLAVFPLFIPKEGGPAYLTLPEAMEKGLLLVTEVSLGGAVPELKVVNQAGLTVLFLDGEELAGAKQNRVLNTTVLLKENSETVIPVSCTERGRWSYTSSVFDDSGIVMHREIRAMKVCSVHRSLETDGNYRADQAGVWDGIQTMAAKYGVSSATGAMKDVYREKSAALEDYLKAIPCRDGQIGLLVFIGGEAAGFDALSLNSAYRRLHAKLLKSYALDALGAKKISAGGLSRETAQEFLKKAGSSKGKRFASIGHGWDWRFRGKGVIGSALEYQDTVIHAAFFRLEEGRMKRNPGPIRGYRARRDSRGSAETIIK